MNKCWRPADNADDLLEDLSEMGDNSEIEETLSDTEEMEDIEYDSDATVMSEDIFSDNGERLQCSCFIVHLKDLRDLFRWI